MATSSPEASWYPDPKDPSQIRYWDGDAWTEHVAPAPVPSPSTASSLSSYYSSTEIVISSTASKTKGFSEVAKKAIQENAPSGESPWFVLASGTDGVMAAFQKELLIVKVGAMTSFMSGATGGGRITHFPYRQITTIEYNGGFALGVLEILTASYSGATNKDFWSIQQSNSSGGDPRQQNNTLPVSKVTFKQVTPQLNRIRELIEESHEVKISLSDAGSGTLALQISELGKLLEQGLIDEQEFQAGKKKILGI